MRFLLTTFTFFFTLSLGAQTLWVNNGTDVMFSQGLEVKVNGNFLNSSASVLQSSADLYIGGSIENKGAFNHNGTLHLQNDWIQNGVFEDGNAGTVRLEGDLQLLTGDSGSDFSHLVCSGTGVKRQTRNITTGILELNDRLLETDSFSLLVRENHPAAITRTTGFVSSARFGMLKRAMIPGSDYLFPVGFAANYRPVLVIPPVSSTSGVRYAQIDASEEGLQRTFTDSSICQTNPEFYHLLTDMPEGTGIRVVIESSFAEEWDGISSRPIFDPSVWEPATSLTEVINDSTYYSYVLEEEGDRAFLLYKSRPEQPVILGESELCALNSGVVYTVNNIPGTELVWNVAGGTQVTAGGNAITVNWGQGPTGSVTVVGTEVGGCSSLPEVLAIQLNTLPIADFIIHPPAFPFEDEVFRFESINEGFSGYFWNIAENFFPEGQEVAYAFPEPGIYDVTHIVTDTNQCRDTVTKQVEVIEGIAVPDVFSPNGDGINDKLEVVSSGIENFSFSIFDRWGNTVFSANKAKSNWDGRTSSGKLVPPGTYYYLLSAASSSAPYDKKGFITIIY